MYVVLIISALLPIRKVTDISSSVMMRFSKAYLPFHHIGVMDSLYLDIAFKV